MGSYSQGMPPYLMTWLTLCSIGTSPPCKRDIYADSRFSTWYVLSPCECMWSEVPRRENDCEGSIVELGARQ